MSGHSTLTSNLQIALHSGRASYPISLAAELGHNDLGGSLDEEQAARQRMMSCAICGESTITEPASALLTVRAPSGRTGAFAAHGKCVIGVFHPNARALLDAAPIIPAPE